MSSSIPTIITRKVLLFF